ncbi:MAG: [protein-PII] uridylyltransferase [Actinomycetota bacterium]
MGLVRDPLLANRSLTGRAWCRTHSDLVDGWLAELFTTAAGSATRGLALVAVGGYGRAELCPQSDIDLMLLHDRRPDVAAIADRIWYPIWDQELHLGHSVCSVREALGLAADDLDTATALLSARHLAGDAELTSRLGAAALERWRRRSRTTLLELADRVERRHEKSGEIAFRSEPDLKDGRGGLRDVHALRWAGAARPILLDEDAVALEAAYGTLLDTRVEMHRSTGRPTNVLAFEQHADVAAALALSGPDELMTRIAEAGRAIAWTSDDAWRRLRSALRGPIGRGAAPARALGDGLRLQDGEVVVVSTSEGADRHPTRVLRAAAAAAGLHAVIERASLERFAAASTPVMDPWPPDARERLIELLCCGASAIPVIESLDQRGVWADLLPEWRPVRALPQPDGYHDFTVDRHLLETSAYAARLADRVARPDLLVVAALLHDIGKGSGGDHIVAGFGLAGRIGDRLGFPRDDVATLVSLVTHHLLLRDVATRRDIDDPATVEHVARAVGSIDVLRLLAALTEADGAATGTAAWDPWKAELVDRLVDQVAHRLDGSARATPVSPPFPSKELLQRLAAGGRHLEARGDVLTVMIADRPGVFSRVAGVLALHGLDVLAAGAHSTDDGRALAEFRVTDPFRDETPWDRILADLELALEGRLALQARMSERARTYERAGSGRATVPVVTVAFDHDASADATVIDVQTADGIGVLYRITRALAELDVDIRSARVQTLGFKVHDAFYVRDRHGKIDDAHMLAEIERAIVHGLTR